MTNDIERHSPDVWRTTAAALAKTASSSVETASHASGFANTTGSISNTEVNVNGAPLLGDTRDLFRPKTSDIPSEPGVYKWRDGEGRVIYVGKAKSLRNRLTNYFQPLYLLHPRTQTMVLTARSLEWTVVGTELEALTLEYTWIKEFDPRFNVQFRDDKTYPYLAISSGEEIPRVWVTRSRKRRDTRYFGPYAKVWELRQSLDKLLRTFPVRTCSSNVMRKAALTNRPCLLASIGKCSAPCVGRIDPKEHRRMCEQLVGVMTGRLGRTYVARLTREMKEASAELEFEKAARLRDEISMLETVMQQNAVVFDQNVDADVFGMASDELEASVHAFYVRDGSIRGERNWSVERVEDVTDAELIADLIVQVYADHRDDTQTDSNQSSEVEDDGDTNGKKREKTTSEEEDTSGDNEGDSEGDSDNPDATKPSSVETLTVETLSSGGSIVEERRDAIGSTQSLTATDSVTRAQATRARRERREQTGRADLLVPIAPVPREVIVPVEPSRKDELETWLSSMRGAAVTIRTATRGEKKALMDRANDNARQALQRSKMSRISDMGARTTAMNDVARALGLSQAPLRIECYDISNTVGGAFQVASMVVFEDAIAKKSEYRRFAIRGNDDKGALDDLSALYETLTRRFRHGNVAGDSGESLDNEQRAERVNAAIPTMPISQAASYASHDAAHTSQASDVSVPLDASIANAGNLEHSAEVLDTSATSPIQQNTNRHRFAYKPNLVVVDGGKPQVMAAAQALADCGVDDVAVCGLAKRLEEVWVPDDDYPIILKRQSEGMYLLQRVRDESHRFAITYHRQTRRKGALRSALDDIPGIGQSYQKRLLAHFGSVRAMREASIEDLEAVKGVGRAKAEAIFRSLHADDGSGKQAESAVADSVGAAASKTPPAESVSAVSMRSVVGAEEHETSEEPAASEEPMSSTKLKKTHELNG